MRGKGFRSRRPDQPVDEHRVAVRYRLEKVTQCGQCRVVGMRPLPDDLVLANRPLPRSQPGAYPQVVDVAAARPSRVADPGGQGGYTIPSRAGPLRVDGLRRFVQTRGGGYFFLPGQRFLTYLAT